MLLRVKNKFMHIYVLIYYNKICMGSRNVNVCLHLYVHYVYYPMKLVCVCTDATSDDWEG